jgi:hypothetical protein
MHVTTLLLAIPSLPTLVSGASNAVLYTYECGDCKCNDVQSAPFDGTTNGACLDIDNGLIIALGLSGGSSFWC